MTLASARHAVAGTFLICLASVFLGHCERRESDSLQPTGQDLETTRKTGAKDVAEFDSAAAFSEVSHDMKQKKKKKKLSQTIASLETTPRGESIVAHPVSDRETLEKNADEPDEGGRDEAMEVELSRESIVYDSEPATPLEYDDLLQIFREYFTSDINCAVEAAAEYPNDEGEQRSYLRKIQEWRLWEQGAGSKPEGEGAPWAVRAQDLVKAAFVFVRGHRNTRDWADASQLFFKQANRLLGDIEEPDAENVALVQKVISNFLTTDTEKWLTKKTPHANNMAPTDCQMTYKEASTNLGPELLLLGFLVSTQELTYYQARAAVRSEWKGGGYAGYNQPVGDLAGGLKNIRRDLVTMPNLKKEWFNDRFPILWSGVNPYKHLFVYIESLLNGYVLTETRLGNIWDVIWDFQGSIFDKFGDIGEKDSHMWYGYRFSWRSPSLWFARAFRERMGVITPRVSERSSSITPRVSERSSSITPRSNGKSKSVPPADKSVIFIFESKKHDFNNDNFDSNYFTTFYNFEKAVLAKMITDSEGSQNPWNPHIFIIKAGERIEMRDCQTLQVILCGEFWPRKSQAVCKKDYINCISCVKSDPAGLLACMIYALTAGILHNVNWQTPLYKRLIKESRWKAFEEWIREVSGYPPRVPLRATDTVNPARLYTALKGLFLNLPQFAENFPGYLMPHEIAHGKRAIEGLDADDARRFKELDALSRKSDVAFEGRELWAELVEKKERQGGLLGADEVERFKDLDALRRKSNRPFEGEELELWEKLVEMKKRQGIFLSDPTTLENGMMELFGDRSFPILHNQ